MYEVLVPHVTKESQNKPLLYKIYSIKAINLNENTTVRYDMTSYA